MGKEERLGYASVAKGFGIITVLCAHTGYGIIWVQPYYMPMFFVISGCIFRFLQKNEDDCLRSFEKMVGIYFKYSVIVATLYIPLFFYKQNDLLFVFRNIFGIFWARKALYSPLEIDNNIIFMEFGNGPMWFLNCLAIAWLLFIPLYKCRKHWSCIGVIIFYLIFGDILGKMKIMFPWSVDTAFVAAIFIFIGIKYEEFRQKYLLNFEGGGYRIKRLIIGYGLCVILYTLILKTVSIRWNMSIASYHSSVSSRIYFFCMFSMLGSVMMLLACCMLEKMPCIGVVVYLGERTLPILCFHAVIYQYIEIVNSKFNLQEYSCYTASKILIATVFSLYVDKLINMIKNKVMVGRKRNGKESNENENM